MSLIYVLGLITLPRAFITMLNKGSSNASVLNLISNGMPDVTIKYHVALGLRQTFNRKGISDLKFYKELILCLIKCLL